MAKKDVMNLMMGLPISISIWHDARFSASLIEVGDYVLRPPVELRRTRHYNRAG
jgi:hypothetical protein